VSLGIGPGEGPCTYAAQVQRLAVLPEERAGKPLEVAGKPVQLKRSYAYRHLGGPAPTSNGEVMRMIAEEKAAALQSTIDSWSGAASAILGLEDEADGDAEETFCAQAKSVVGEMQSLFSKIAAISPQEIADKIEELDPLFNGANHVLDGLEWLGALADTQTLWPRTVPSGTRAPASSSRPIRTMVPSPSGSTPITRSTARTCARPRARSRPGSR